ncbi:hypothetical protein [Leptospira ilyithenensis]|uniref:SCP-2 sterol transfer family protein n=1 Tax=Leptospira ilyithenensis TaxID=2484901 RepID=A0A4R9LV36_9LEPT|nr:hypothetical protein [Leptospira ilyithenensis]TGN16799.1 hypothetical protein EHS11_00330 [Leptospira ilyithenensis]
MITFKNIILAPKFSILLLTMYYFLKRSHSKRMKELLSETDFVLQIRTEKGNRGGYFSLKDRNLSFDFGIHPSPDFSQIWKTSQDAYITLSKRNETEILRAYEAGKYRMNGSFLIGLWFAEVTKISIPR